MSFEKEISETINTYEKNAEKYAEITNDVDMKRNLDKFLNVLNGKKILDIGCGPGRDSEYFDKKGFDVTGIDLTKKFVEMSSKRVPRGRFIQMNMKNLRFKDESFDGVWSCASFLHIPKSEAEDTLKEFYRVLMKKGVIFMSTQEGTGEDLIPSNNYGSERRFFSSWEKEDLKNLFEKVGFLIKEVKIDKGKWITILAIK